MHRLTYGWRQRHAKDIALGAYLIGGRGLKMCITNHVIKLKWFSNASWTAIMPQK